MEFFDLLYIVQELCKKWHLRVINRKLKELATNVEIVSFGTSVSGGALSTIFRNRRGAILSGVAAIPGVTAFGLSKLKENPLEDVLYEQLTELEKMVLKQYFKNLLTSVLPNVDLLTVPKNIYETITKNPIAESQIKTGIIDFINTKTQFKVLP